nr:galanin peptides [Vicugna pacos]
MSHQVIAECTEPITALAMGPSTACARKQVSAVWVKEKRGWTLNSAGYLLGPHAIDNHRSFQDKHGLAGKRELPPDDETRPGSFDRPLSENNVVRTIIDFLNFLHLKEAGALERLPGLPAALSSEDTEQS